MQLEVIDMTALYVGLSILGVIFLVIYAVAMWRTRNWERGTKDKDKDPPLKGLALPEGSIRGLIAFLVVGAFVLFAFFGKDAVSYTTQEVNKYDTGGNLVETSTTEDTTLFTTVLTAFGTLTGAVAGFYFGGRSAQAGNSNQAGGSAQAGNSTKAGSGQG